MQRSIASSPPLRAARRVLVREPLLARLTQARRRRCIVIKGPPGSGKTSLAAAWRQALVPLGFDLAWVALTAQDDVPARFIDALLDGISQVHPALGREAARPSGGDDGDALERTLISLVRAAAVHARDLVLVVDDLHRVSDPRILDALQWLLDHAPPYLHLVLVTRSTPRLDLTQLRARGETLEIGPADLRLSPAESTRLLRSQLGDDLDAATIRGWHKLTDGWITGLQLLAADRRRQPPAEGEDMVVRGAALTGYFESEVLRCLSPLELRTLVSVASCKRFCASLGASLSGRQHEAGDVLRLLSQLEQDCLFVLPAKGSEPEPWYRLHPVLRQTLLLRFSALDPAMQRDIHARACAWLRTRGLLDEAVHHALLAGEPRQAAELVEQCAMPLYMRGELGRLVGLLQLLPAGQVQGSFALRAWCLQVRFYQHDFAACEAELVQLEREVPTGELQQRFLLAILRAMLAMRRDDLPGALAVLPLLQHPPADTPAVHRGARRNLLSWIGLHQGAYDQARQLQDAPAMLVDGVPFAGTASGSLMGQCLVGLSHAMEGRITQAGRIYRAVAAQAEQHGKAATEAHHLACALLGDVLYELDDVQQARELLEVRLEAIERSCIPDGVLRALRTLAAIDLQAGRPLDARACLDRLVDYALGFGLDRLLAIGLGDQVHLQLACGELMAAEATLQRLEAVAARHPQAVGMRADIYLAAERARIRVHMAHGDFELAAVKLAALTEAARVRGLQRAVATLVMAGAVADERRGRHEAAQQKVLEALRLGHKLGLLRSLLDAERGARRLILDVARSQVLDPVLAFYVERLGRAQVSGPPALRAHEEKRKPPPAGGALSGREAEVFALLAQVMPNKKIARALGVSPDTVKWHLGRIYSKLGVAGRDEALARARDLGWVTGALAPPPAAGAAAFAGSHDRRHRGTLAAPMPGAS